MISNDTTFWNHLPVEKDALLWGLNVVTGGSASIPPNTPYRPKRHPDKALFLWEEGRTLEDYQIIYIVKGGGVLETSETSRNRIEAGQVFLLFPGVWHRYQPDIKTGWDENWVGFNGEIADRIMGGFFSPKKPVLPVGFDQELLSLIRSIPDLMDLAHPGYQELMAARTMETIALLRSRALSYNAFDRETVRKVQEARYYLLEHNTEEIDMESLAKQLGLSYSRFRVLFKEQTGTTPHQYQVDIRMKKARDLLLHSTYTISKISERLGFTSAYYFSRIFKQRNGCSPRAYRERKGNLKNHQHGEPVKPSQS